MRSAFVRHSMHRCFMTRPARSSDRRHPRITRSRWYVADSRSGSVCCTPRHRRRWRPTAWLPVAGPPPLTSSECKLYVRRIDMHHDMKAGTCRLELAVMPISDASRGEATNSFSRSALTEASGSSESAALYPWR